MRFVLVILVLSGLLACKEDPFLDDIVVHRNGLQVPVPKGFSISAEPHGFEFVETGDIRTPRRMIISYVSAPPIGRFETRRNFHNSTAFFTVEEQDGGSAGVHYNLRAMKFNRGGWVVLAASDQREWLRPDFDLAWQILEHADMR